MVLLRGSLRASSTVDDSLGSVFGTLRTRPFTFQPEPSRGQLGTSAPTEIPPDSLVRVETPDGVSLYSRADALPLDRGFVDLPRLSRSLSPSSAQRGLDPASLVIELLELSPLPGLAADLTVAAAVQFLETRLQHRFGLWQLPDIDDAPRIPDAWAPFHGDAGAPGAPALLLLHGTLSLPSQSFGPLAATDAWRALRRRYPGRVLAHAAPTLSASPIANAIDLVRSLPPRAVLDIVSYSRGGLVGELLAAPPSPLDASSLAALTARADARDPRWRTSIDLLHEELKAFRSLLRERHITVNQHLRVAAPLLGTPLAGRRLDHWLSFILSTLGTLTPLGADPIYGFIKRTALEIIRRKGDASMLPGLAAMDPDGTLVRALALRGQTTVSTLAVTGDVQGSGFLGRVAVAAVDLFFGEPNDLVVPTGAMVSARFAPNRSTLERRVALHDAGAHHFGYFTHPQVRDLLKEWPALPSTDADRGVGAFALGLTLPLRKPNDAPEKPAVVLLPGFPGTSLRKHDPATGTSTRLWPDAASIIAGRFAELRFDPSSDGIRPEAPLDAYYGNLARGLVGDFDVHPMGFDWRDSIPVIAKGIADRIKTEILGRNAKRAVHLVGHSMGGVVAMTMLWSDPDLAKQLHEKGSRLLLLGVPTAGTFDPVNLLLGDNLLLDLLALADLTHDRARFIEVLRSFPGLIQLTSDSLVSDGKRWPAVRDRLQLDPSVESSAKAFWATRHPLVTDANAAPFALKTYYVYGRDRKTIDGFEVDSTGEVVVRNTRNGDGTVPWTDGRVGNLERQWWIKATHSRIPADIDPRAVADILLDGDTVRLLNPPPEQMQFYNLRDGSTDADEAPNRPEVRRIPNTEDLLAAAMGHQLLSDESTRDERSPAPGTAPVAESPSLTVKVVHGSLHTASDVIVLGVFEGDPPSELALLLDRITDGLVQQLWSKGGWPIQTGTWCTVGHPAKPAALLVNLGSNGSLTRTSLVAHTSRALRAWLLGAAQQSGRVVSPSISAALVGGDGANALGPEEIAVALVEATLKANRLLCAHPSAPSHIRALSFFEPYRDLTSRVSFALQNFADWTALDYDPRELTVDAEVRSTEGYFGARPGSSGTWDTWSTMTITSVEETGALRLTVTTGDRLAARFRQRYRLPTALLERLKHMAGAGPDDATEASALFAAGSTREVRALVRTGSGLVLHLDARSAAIPWELLLRGTNDDDFEPRDAVLRVLQAGRRVTDLLPATQRTALVVGDPLPEGVLPLPGARFEAEGVRSRLRAGPGGAWGTTGHDGADATEILAWLGSGSFRILHLATHGRVLNGRTEVHLGGNYWEGAELLDRVCELPQFVFLNACHVGADMKEPAGFASSIAQAFLKRGVQAIVVAGWAVNDAAARTFAEALYDRILDGETFGRAVRAARLQTRRQHPRVNTWGAYQCYGNPLTVLVPEARLDRRLRRAPFCPSPEDAIDALHSLQGDARLLEPSRRDALKAAIDRCAAALPPGVARSAEVQRRLGMLWLEVGDLKRASRALEGALKYANKAQFDLVEWAADTFSRRAAGGLDLSHWETLERASGLLDAAEKLQPQRNALRTIRAHHQLRQDQWQEARATLQEGRARAAKQVSAARANGKTAADARFAVDALLLEIALDGDDSNLQAALVETRLARNEALSSRDTFTRRAVCELELLTYLRGDSSDPAKVAQAYGVVLKRQVSRLWLDLVRDFLCCVRRAAGPRKPSWKPSQKRLGVVLDEIIEALDQGEPDEPPPGQGPTDGGDGRHLVVVRHLRRGDADLAERFIVEDDRVAKVDAFTTGRATPATIQAMIAKGLTIEDLGPIAVRTVARESTAATRGATLLFRGDPEPKSQWPADFRVEGDWPFVDPLIAVIKGAGGAVLSREGPTAVLARLDDGAQRDLILRNPMVRAVERRGLAQVGPFATTGGEGFRGDASEPETWDVTLSRVDDVKPLADSLQRSGDVIVGTGRRIVRIHATAARAREIAALPGVVRVAVYVVPRLANERVRPLVGLAPTGLVISSVAPPITLDGRGEVIAIADSGLDVDHPDFKGRPVVVLNRTKAAAGDQVGHGTHVAGTIGSSGKASKGQLRGIAPGATLVVQKIAEAAGGTVSLTGLPVDLGDLLAQAAASGATIHNWSWGAYARGDYTADCVEVDAWLHEHPGQLLVIAAGNEGKANTPPGAERFAAKGFVEWSSVTSPGTSKNALVVGASRSDRTTGGRAELTYGTAFEGFSDPPTRDELISGKPDELAAFSGRGPSISEQVRPDLVAPGTDILSTRSTAVPDREYWGVDKARGAAYWGGTSMATPVVTACAALVRQYFRGVRKVAEPSAALIKATLIAGAQWLRGVSALADRDRRPNIHQGFGRVDLSGTIPSDGNFSLAFVDSWKSAGVGFELRGQKRDYVVKVAAGHRLRICLAYTDAPGKGLQNDLQLLAELGGSTAIGNEGINQSPFSPAAGRFDRHNNVKVIDFEAPQSGDCHIQVTADSLPYPRQDFALVVLGALSGDIQRI